MTETPDNAPVSELSYEQARDELVALVSRIESGKVPLEEAMLLWERGEQLAAHCQAKLDAAQESLDRATAPQRDASRGQERSGDGADADDIADADSVEDAEGTMDAADTMDAATGPEGQAGAPGR